MHSLAAWKIIIGRLWACRLAFGIRIARNEAIFISTRSRSPFGFLIWSGVQSGWANPHFVLCICSFIMREPYTDLRSLLLRFFHIGVSFLVVPLCFLVCRSFLHSGSWFYSWWLIFIHRSWWEQRQLVNLYAW